MQDDIGGSPPRAWGRRVADGREHAQHRFTPTRVGTTGRGNGMGSPVAVHPHARGDDVHAGFGVRLFDGSPPRAWGRPFARFGGVSGRRFTPTRVGTTVTRCQHRDKVTVHPHARGDDAPVQESGHTRPGSPPRAWGRLQGLQLGQLLRRFTPTRVGTTWRGAVMEKAPSVHPHARGDDEIPSSRASRTVGSPPRAWGRRTRPLSTWLIQAVHPHARGDDIRLRPCVCRTAGSPPRAWGRHPGGALVHRGARFTPTRVGTTRTGPGSAGCCAVHPHARGDDLGPRFPHRMTVGSPPRAWGRPPDTVFVIDKERFTPTRVGTTRA